MQIGMQSFWGFEMGPRFLQKEFATLWPTPYPLCIGLLL
jgi:hypothetical protein